MSFHHQINPYLKVIKKEIGDTVSDDDDLGGVTPSEESSPSQRAIREYLGADTDFRPIFEAELD